jgi:hypothetical protein
MMTLAILAVSVVLNVPGRVGCGGVGDVEQERVEAGLHK